jgi:hypothetical protein
METVSTAKYAAQRLEDYVSRHGCGSLACDVCSDMVPCLSPLSVESKAARRPRPPGDLVDCLQDAVYISPRPARAAYAVRVPPAASLAPRLPSGSPDSPAGRRAALIAAHVPTAEVVFGGELACY